MCESCMSADVARKVELSTIAEAYAVAAVHANDVEAQGGTTGKCMLPSPLRRWFGQLHGDADVIGLATFESREAY